MTSNAEPRAGMEVEARELFKCGPCEGTGKVLASRCSGCNGSGCRRLTVDELLAFAAHILEGRILNDATLQAARQSLGEIYGDSEAQDILRTIILSAPPDPPSTPGPGLQCPKCQEVSTLSWVAECDNGHEFQGPDLQTINIATGADNRLIEVGQVQIGKLAQPSTPGTPKPKLVPCGIDQMWMPESDIDGKWFVWRHPNPETSEYLLTTGKWSRDAYQEGEYTAYMDTPEEAFAAFVAEFFAPTGAESK